MKRAACSPTHSAQIGGNMKRRTFMSLLFAAALGCTALSFPAMAADPTLIEGSKGANSQEGPKCLFDDDVKTKWCTAEKNPYVIFKLPEAESISSYTIITANDNSRYPGRNPISWTLYGCNGQSSPDADSDQWQVIDSVTEDTVLQNVNYTAYAFPVSGTVPAYKYYKFQVDKKNSFIQMSELKLSREETRYITTQYIDGIRGINERESPKYLFDSDAGTKWCTNASKNPYVIFKTSEPVSATGYHMVTANDNSSYKDRNPSSWRFYGCNSSADPDPWFDGWQVIDTVTEDTTLTDTNYKEFTFTFSKKAPAYQYYMLWVDEKESAILQLSELALSYEGSSFNFSIPQATSSGSSSDSQGVSTGIGLMCASCHGSGKDHCFTCRGTGFSGNHICFVCGGAGFKPCTACHGAGYIQ